MSPDGRWMASSSADQVLLWDMKTSEYTHSALGATRDASQCVAFSPDSSELMVLSNELDQVTIWSVDRPKKHRKLKLPGKPSAVAWSPTGDEFAYGSKYTNTVTVCKVSDGEVLHVLSGHTATIADVKCQESDPQVITGSMDSTVRYVAFTLPNPPRLTGMDSFVRRLWDLAAGRTMVTLTHHKKSVRALAIHPTEYSFASASAGGNNIKKWKCPEGTFVCNFSGHNAIINTMSVNSEGVLFSGGMRVFLYFPPRCLC